MSVNTGDS
uniref:Uncharacterized protein n=1 Tax=Anguilla anguilla TaxID=7936 RepID=A0A0E9W1H9_ANGAN